VIELSAPGTNFVDFVAKLQKGEALSTDTKPILAALECTSLAVCSEVKEREWSPVFHMPTESCPRWLIDGATEEIIPLSQQEELFAAAQAAGCEATLEVFATKQHAMSYFVKAKPGILRFIER
jgi:hypothetical protein